MGADQSATPNYSFPYYVPDRSLPKSMTSIASYSTATTATAITAIDAWMPPAVRRYRVMSLLLSSPLCRSVPIELFHLIIEYSDLGASDVFIHFLAKHSPHNHSALYRLMEREDWFNDSHPTRKKL